MSIETKTDYRHEWKHEINWQDCLIIRQRLRAVAQPDPYAKGGFYQICSLYFDNLNDKALREKLDGVICREKFRIRYYNHDPSVIHLEKKSKLNGLGSKFMCALTKDEAEKIIRNDLNWMVTDERPLVCELYFKMKSQGLRPKTIVDYIREPYVYGPGNCRITLDHHIRTGLNSVDFLDPDCPTIPVPDDPIILEVKWDAYLPDLIRGAVQLKGRRVSAYSKYAACRSYV